MSQRLPEVAFKIVFSNYFQTFQLVLHCKHLMIMKIHREIVGHKNSQRNRDFMKYLAQICTVYILLSLTATNYSPFLPLSLSTQASISWVIQTFSLLQSYRYQVRPNSRVRGLNSYFLCRGATACIHRADRPCKPVCKRTLFLVLESKLQLSLVFIKN